MDNSVVIKSGKHGIVVVLDNEPSFDEIKTALREKFQASARFLGNASLAVSFEGRELSDAEQQEVLDIISEVTEVNIVCILDNNALRDRNFKTAVEAKMKEMDTGAGHFYKGTLRSGQVLESDASIIILGDVNPGGKVIAKGNVVVLGSLSGNIYAGSDGNEDAFVVAIDMNPMQIRIGDVIARCSDGNQITKAKVHEPKIAYVSEGNIYIEKLERNVLADIRL